MDNAPEPIERLYLTCGPALLGYLRSFLGDAHAAQDILQQTFVQVIRRPELLDKADSPRAWVFGIARNLARDSIRRHRNTMMLPEQLADKTSTPDPRIQAIRRAIGKLPGEMQETLMLRLNQELSYQEIAEVLKVPVGTVRSRLHRAVRNLRESIISRQEW